MPYRYSDTDILSEMRNDLDRLDAEYERLLAAQELLKEKIAANSAAMHEVEEAIFWLR